MCHPLITDRGHLKFEKIYFISPWCSHSLCIKCINSLFKKENEKEKKIFYALHFKCSCLYTKHTQKSTKFKINACLNGESSENLRREESRSPLALPEWRFHFTSCCCCYRRVTRNEAIPRMRTQSLPSFICKSTHRQNKRLLMSGLTNI